MRRILSIVCLCALLAVLASSCRRARVPKPYGYFRVEIPDTAYAYADLDGYPYQFLLSQNAVVEPREKDGEKYWIDIQYPTLNVTTVASAIPVQEYLNDAHRTYGLYYELHGNTATPYQFYLTDSVRHFFRGSVYCNTIPNQDSLAPIYEYLRKDVRVMMESMQWR